MRHDESLPLPFSRPYGTIWRSWSPAVPAINRWAIFRRPYGTKIHACDRLPFFAAIRNKRGRNCRQQTAFGAERQVSHYQGHRKQTQPPSLSRWSVSLYTTELRRVLVRLPGANLRGRKVRCHGRSTVCCSTESCAPPRLPAAGEQASGRLTNRPLAWVVNQTRELIRSATWCLTFDACLPPPGRLRRAGGGRQAS